MKRLPFAELVLRAMREQGVSLRALCRDAKLDASFFSKVLAGKRSPPSEESALRRIAGALKLDPIAVIVATGRIPSEWQPLFRDPAVIATIERMAGQKTAPLRQPAAATSPTGRGHDVVMIPSARLSDDLL